MPRPPRIRRVGFVPLFERLVPMTGAEAIEENEITITVDEAEALRLSDLEGMDQEQAAQEMNVARTTFQRIVHEARYKMARCLILGNPLRIAGGSYEIKLCQECDSNHGQGCLVCQRKRHGQGHRRRGRGWGTRQ